MIIFVVLLLVMIWALYGLISNLYSGSTCYGREFRDIESWYVTYGLTGVVGICFSDEEEAKLITAHKAWREDNAGK